MKILYVGGSGQISFDCIHETVRAGHDVSVFNRGNHNAGLPDAITQIHGDFNDDAAYRPLADQSFDVVCQFRVFTPDQLQRDIDLFAGKVGRYVFISSASAYHKPVNRLPITEANTPLHNPHWQYSRDKKACEELLQSQGRLPFTIVRPSHTTRDQLVAPVGGGDLLATRLLAGKPIVLPGDGTSLWTLTAAKDFAPPFVKLLSADAGLGEAFHLTSETAHPWSTIIRTIAGALGVEANLVGVPTDVLVRHRPDWEGPLWGDKSWSLIFDNGKLKQAVGDFDCPTTLEEIAAAGVESYRQRGGPKQAVDQELDALFDRIVSSQDAIKV